MADDLYVLPPDDPCHSTVEAFKQIAGTVTDAYWQAATYQRFRGQLDAWQQCCPGLREKAAALKPEITDPAKLEWFVFPSDDVIFAEGPVRSPHLPEGDRGHRRCRTGPGLAAGPQRRAGRCLGRGLCPAEY